MSCYPQKNIVQVLLFSQDPKCINALLGDAATSSSRSERLTKLNRILVQFPNIAPPLIEKMELALASKDWQQCSELCERLLGINEKNSVANKVKTPPTPVFKDMKASFFVLIFTFFLLFFSYLFFITFFPSIISDESVVSHQCSRKL